MTFVQPISTFRPKQQESDQSAEQPLRRVSDGFWTTAVMEILKSHGQTPIRITTLVNRAVQKENFRHRKDRERQKRNLLILTCRLIKMGRLDRVQRKYVKLPASDHRFNAYLDSIAGDLPRPEL